GLAEINSLARGPRRAGEIPVSGGESTSEGAARPNAVDTTTAADETPGSAGGVGDSGTYGPTTSSNIVSGSPEVIEEPSAQQAPNVPQREGDSSAGAVTRSDSLGDQALVTQNAANPSLTRPSPWVRAG